MVIHEPISLEPLPMRREIRVPVSANQYRVITGSGQELEVEAGTAYEAFKRSGATHAIKIERLANIRPVILPKGVFIKQDAPAHETTEPNNAHEEVLLHLKRHRAPVISADEMDRLMNMLRGEALASESPSSAAPTHEVPVLHAGLTQNDGFDEMIPTAAPLKPVPVVRSASVASDVPAASAIDEPATDEDAAPAKELSQDEINKLLGD